MAIFEVNNEIELGNAIWSSRVGDNIVLKSGEYGNLPIKYGVNYEFVENATAADILGLGIGDGQWSASSVQIGNISIKNPRIQKENIKLYYIFQKKLPFNCRFEPPITFVHANGVIIHVIGNDKVRFSLSGIGENAEAQLPKCVVNIVVPSLIEFDVNVSSANYLSPMVSDNLSADEIEHKMKKHQKEIEKKNDAENSAFNSSMGLNLNDFEYKALWALNSFVREYARITGEKRIKGYSISEFKDGLLTAITKSLDEASFNRQQFIERFTNSKLSDEQVINLSTAFCLHKNTRFQNSHHTI